MKYILSTGKITQSREQYVLDLFRLYTTIYPGDIPGASTIGFDFLITDIKKDELASTVKNRLSSLVKTLQSKFNGITISLRQIDLVSENRVKVIVDVNDYSDVLEINI